MSSEKFFFLPTHNHVLAEREKESVMLNLMQEAYIHQYRQVQR